MDNDTFTCDECKQTFEKVWSDEEATAEAEELMGFGCTPEGGASVVCEDCFQKILLYPILVCK